MGKLYYESDTLRHDATYPNGQFKPKKYIKKLPIGNGKYRYFYSQKEYDAFTNRRRHEVNEHFGFGTNGKVPYDERRGGMKSEGSTRTSEEIVKAANKKAKSYNSSSAGQILRKDEESSIEAAYARVKREHETKKKQKRINRKRKLQKSLKKLGINWDW